MSSGLGPNVNINGTLEDIGEGENVVVASREVVDANSSGSPPFAGDSKKSPHASSAAIKEGGVHGGGDLGSSNTT